jgi:hypothetical protein
VLGAGCDYAAFDSVDLDVSQPPFRITGEIEQVVMGVSGEVVRDYGAELKRLMTQQWS